MLGHLSEGRPGLCLEALPKVTCRRAQNGKIPLPASPPSHLFLDLFKSMNADFCLGNIVEKLAFLGPEVCQGGSISPAHYPGGWGLLSPEIMLNPESLCKETVLLLLFPEGCKTHVQRPYPTGWFLKNCSNNQKPSLGIKCNTNFFSFDACIAAGRSEKSSFCLAFHPHFKLVKLPW